MTRIENEMQYNSAMERINQLLKEVNDNTPEDDIRSMELVLLSNLVADYEDEHYPIEKPSLIDVLKLRMYELGLTQSGLAAKLGMNQSKVSEIISGKSEPTLKQARKISQELKISPAIVLGVTLKRYIENVLEEDATKTDASIPAGVTSPKIISLIGLAKGANIDWEEERLKYLLSK